jgi:hypothetical protein
MAGRSHRVGRVLSFFSSRRNWDSPSPHRQARMPPSLWFRGGGAHSLAGKGWGSPNSKEGTYTVLLFLYTYFVGGVNRRYNSSTHFARSVQAAGIDSYQTLVNYYYFTVCPVVAIY